MGKLTICVYGAASDNIDAVYIKETEKLGKEIALRHHQIIYGGGATGVMGACARGAAEVGGSVIGVVPRFMSKIEKLNENCTKLIQTETMSERKEIMENEADAFIIAPGGIGTLDEFFQILTLIELKRKSAPIIIFNVDGFYNDLIAFLDTCIRKGFVRADVKDLLRICDSPEKAVDLIEYFADVTYKNE